MSSDAPDSVGDVDEVPRDGNDWSDMPDFEGLRNSKLHQEYLQRLPANRDLRLYITAASETGVGKTTLAVALALLWDIYGWTPDKATLDPREYSFLYDRVRPGSVLILDEAEQALDKRRNMKEEQVQVGHDFATKRYRQVIGILTLPSRDWMDDRVAEDMADYWIQCQETDKGKPKGEAQVYRLKNNEHYQTSYSKRTETISWPRLDHRKEFRVVEAKKAERMEGTDESNYVRREEFEAMKDNFWNKATKKTRYHMVKAMCEWGLTQEEAAEITRISDHVEGIGQRRVSDFVNSEKFEEVYKSA